MRCFTEVIEEELSKRGFKYIKTTISLDITTRAISSNDEIIVTKLDYPSVWFQLYSTKIRYTFGGKTLGEVLFKYDNKQK